MFESWKPQARAVTLQRGVQSVIVFDMIGQDGKLTPAGALPASAHVTATLTDAAGTGAPIPLDSRTRRQEL